MELAEGVEPTTYCLQGSCSAIELRQRAHHCSRAANVTPPVHQHIRHLSICVSILRLTRCRALSTDLVWRPMVSAISW